MKRAGLLNEIIEIYKVVWEKDKYGSQVETLELVTTTRARVVYNNGSRNIENSEIVHNYNKTFIVRYYVPINDYDKILWQGKYYRVLSIDSSREYQEKTINTELIND